MRCEGDGDECSLAIALKQEYDFWVEMRGREMVAWFCSLVCLWLLYAWERLGFLSRCGTWIKCGSLELCEARSGAVQGMGCHIFENCCALCKHLGNY